MDIRWTGQAQHVVGRDKTSRDQTGFLWNILAGSEWVLVSLFLNEMTSNGVILYSVNTLSRQRSKYFAHSFCIPKRWCFVLS